jgi:hypothetical protein
MLDPRAIAGNCDVLGAVETFGISAGMLIP